MASYELRKPTVELHQSWLESLAEWGTLDQDGASVFFAEKFDWNLHDKDDFAQWVQLLNNLEDPEYQAPEGFVSQSTLWVCSGDQYLGAVSLRHALINDYLETVGGHVGYGIRPSARRKGLAKLALAGAVELATNRGLQKLLITCNDSNTGSYKTIESCGGLLEHVLPRQQVQESFGSQDAVRRYWIQL